MGQSQSAKDVGARDEVDQPVVFDENFNHGTSLPVKKRHCTDVLCGVAFFICISLLGVLAGYSFVMGDYRRIVFPKDSQSKICGIDYPDRRNLYFFDMLSCLDLPDVVFQFGCPTKQVCVSSCPNYTWHPSDGDSEESREKMVCEGGVSGNFHAYKSRSVEELVNSKICAPNITPTKSILGRCVPTVLFKELQTRNGRVLANPDKEKPPPSFEALVFGSRNLLTKVLEDLVRSWKVILTFLILAAFVSFLWIVVMRFCTCAMVYFTLFLFIALFATTTGFCFWRYVQIKNLSSQTPPFHLTFDITLYFRYSTTWLVLGIIFAIILLLVLCITIFLRKRIALASRVIGETSKAIGYMPFTLFWPIFPFTFILGAITLWLFVDMNLRSIAVPEGVYFTQSQAMSMNKLSKESFDWIFEGARKCDPAGNFTEGQFCFYVKHVVTNYTPWLQFFNFAACLWLINYFIAVDQMTLAGTFSKFYFSQRQIHQRGGSKCCYFCGVHLVFGTGASVIFYHTGSLALGSLLITLLWLIRMILLKIERRLKLANNDLANFFRKCLCCCFWCLDKFLRFLNKNAYIMMAIYGHGFCRSARDAFSLIVRNVVRVFVVETITDFILFVGKLSISAAVAFFAYAYLSGLISGSVSIVPLYNVQLNYMIVPILVIALGSFLVAKAFFTVYEMGVDTIFICVCEDLEHNDGSEEKPYFMSKAMMKTLKKPEVEAGSS